MIVPPRFPPAALLLLIAFPASGGEISSTDPVERPAHETAARLERCLAASGFDVSRREVPGAAIRIDARRGGEVRELVVSPRSPLACDVEWGPDAREALASTFLDGLRACVGGSSAERSANPVPAGGAAPAEVLEREEFVACLRTRREGRDIRFSGLLVGAGGTIVSTAHDLDRVGAVSVRLRDGRTVSGSIGRRDLSRDLCRIDLAEPVPGFRLEGSVRDRLSPGEPVYSIGCADDGTVRIRAGSVGAEPRKSGGMPLWEVRADTVPGSSGGPAFDGAGNLAGLVKGRFRGTKDRGYLIPVDTILEFLGRADGGPR